VKAQRLNDKRALVVDHGLFPSWALRLAREFGEVYYHNPSWKSLSPSSNQLLIGHGFDEITMVKNMWDVVHKMDLICFPYIFDGDLQKELVRQGKRVWGGRNGDELEIYRPEAKEEMKRLGMPVGDYNVVTGLENLRAYLKKHKNVHVKISLTRGDTETFHAPSYEEIIPKLDEIKHFVGAAADAMQVLIEQPIEPALEIGYDGFSIDGKFPSHAINGVEVKDASYLGVILPYADLDEHIRAVNKWLAPALEAYQYRGLFSTEVRVGPDERPYLIDVTARGGSPPSESMQEMIANWGEIMWSGAAGIVVDPEVDEDEEGEPAKYSAQAVIYSDHADEAWQAVTIPDEVRRWVKLFFHCRLSGVDYVIPQPAKFSEIGWVVGTGPTVKAAIKACEEHADQISGYKLEVRTKSLQDAVSEIEKGQALGVQFSDEEINA
jgi:hypothetical protein